MIKVLLAVLGCLVLLGSRCTHNPIGPIQGQGPILYAITEPDGSGNFRVYCIDTYTDEIVDSMHLTAPGTNLAFSGAVSPDGSKLYLSYGVIDTKTKSVIAGALTGFPTPDGKYVIDGNCGANDFMKVIDPPH